MVVLTPAERAAAEVAALSGMSREELAALWEQRFGSAPPRGCGRQLLELAAAYGVQEQAFGRVRNVRRRKSGNDQGHDDQALRDLLQDQNRLHRVLKLEHAAIDLLNTATSKASQLLQVLKDPSSHARKLLHTLITRIDLSAGELRITFNANALHQELGVPDEVESDADQSSGSTPPLILALPFAMRRRGVEARLIIGNTPNPASQVDAGLVDVISRARHWMKLLTTEGHQTIAALARHLDVDDGEISRILPLAFLAPDIVAAILAGRQPVELTARKLIRLKPIPALWADQRLVLGFQKA